MTSETARVGRIVSDLLAFSRRSKPQRAPADLNRIAQDHLSLVQHKMKLSNVEVESQPGEDLPAAPCDPSQIQQVVLNLLLNAAEATQSKTRAPRRPWRRPRGDGVGACCMVSDNGEGIPPENLAKIFDPFFTTKSEGKGVGLGLAVSYGIIQAHGGDIEVKSTVGEGTTFTVSLPLEPPRRADGAAACGTGAEGMKYLYVGATEEVEREALAAVTAPGGGGIRRAGARAWSWAAWISRSTRGAGSTARSRCSKCCSGAARGMPPSCWRSRSATCSSRC